MKLSALCSQMLSGEACDDIDSFFLDIDDFEEVPIFSRMQRINGLLKRLGPRWTSAYLLSLCMHVLATVRIAGSARDPAGTKMFLALSFTDFELQAEKGVLLPNIFLLSGFRGRRVWKQVPGKMRQEHLNGNRRSALRVRRCWPARRFPLLRKPHRWPSGLRSGSCPCDSNAWK